MHWFKPYEEEAAPTTFLDKFYAGRDDPLQVTPGERSTGS
jgi:NADH dehydrogenase (ubiquinone) 1 alpha subcomplex subunit 6